MPRHNAGWNRRRFLLAASTGVSIGLAGCTDDEPSDGGGGTTQPAGGDDDGGGDSAGDTADTETGPDEDEESTPQSASVQVGELVEDDSIQMVVRETRTTESLGEFQDAESGNTFLVVRMAVKNTTDGFINFSGFWQARVKDGSNHVYNASFTVTDHPLGSDILGSGEVARGDMVFEIPSDASGLQLQFDFQAFSLFDFSRVTVDLESTAGNIADVSQSLNVDVLAVGESATHGDVGVTVHGARTTTELGQFTEAEADHEFVILDIEIANNSSEGLNVSSLLQMSMKDGSGFTYSSDIAATSQLDQQYSEGSEISPNSARRGEIAYEIGTDVSPRYWTFNFLDFDAEQKAYWQIEG